MNEQAPGLTVGLVVRDTARDRLGEVVDLGERRVRLRPVDGGREWEADPGRVVVLGRHGSLRVELALVNQRSRAAADVRSRGGEAVWGRAASPWRP
ncbi:hypothetical protein [Streptomyces aidingensis]|uniref:Uncharacterized protein n=1 Tax=Streptomyces aidingensis TaxID=910347 RepID=A0A1I1FSU5_9ACTN|nr:hypothetical protein [Streptomyces aidingensis]SFC00718.1 hypothetical protein SAMN05421773_101803 [Streptomyces aidingensis]